MICINSDHSSEFIFIFNFLFTAGASWPCYSKCASWGRPNLQIVWLWSCTWRNWNKRIQTNIDGTCSSLPWVLSFQSLRPNKNCLISIHFFVFIILRYCREISNRFIYNWLRCFPECRPLSLDGPRVPLPKHLHNQEWRVVLRGSPVGTCHSG